MTRSKSFKQGIGKGPCSREEQWDDMITEQMEGDELGPEETNFWNSEQSVAGCEYGKYRLTLFPQ